MNMGLLVTVEAGIGDGSDEQLLQRVRDIMSGDTLLPRLLRRKLAFSPWNLDHPCWVPNPGFKLEEHIFRHTLAEPANDKALNRRVAEIIQARLSPDRPMWEFHLINGLEDGQTALILKLHHAYADGATGVLLMHQIMDEGGTRNERRLSLRTGADAPMTAGTGIIRLPRQLIYTLFANLGLNLLILYRFLLKRRLGGSSSVTPGTRFNTALGPGRSYTHGTLSIAQMRAISSACACSRNDVFLAIISGALRRYLAEHDELPRQSLYAGLPLALPADDKRDNMANQVAFYRCSLATQVADPLQRLLTIRQRLERATRKARQEWKQRLLERLIPMPPRTVAAMATRYRKLLEKGLLQPNFNVFTTLIPGPAKSASITGRSITGIHPISIPYHGAGLFISAIRYRDQIQFGIIADSEQLTDPGHLADLMQEAFSELHELANKKTDKKA